MGEVVVSALVDEVVGRITSELIKEFRLIWGFKSDISTLKEDFSLNKAYLKDALEKQNNDEAVQEWLMLLKSAIMKAENVLDEISTEALMQRLHKKRGRKYRVRAFFSSDHNMLMFRVKAAHKVKAIRAKLDDIASKRVKLGLNPGATSHVDEDSAGEMPNRETSSLIIRDPASIFGRYEERDMVVEKICNNGIGKYENGEILVYGISGMGGIGKTTLAQLVYHHEKVKQNFPLRCWAYVSEKFEVKEIIKKIIESIDGSKCELTQLDTLQVQLQKKLTRKKFLIVLDDVWLEVEEKAKWDELSRTLSCGEEGSIVVMTTRSSTTSHMMAKLDRLQHKLGCLLEVDSWLLFSKFAFAQGREGDDISVLEPIGREIVEKCSGLPLALKTFGSLMWSKKTTRDWEHVKDSIISKLQENNLLYVLKLSYDSLPLHLKRCFAYCCLFPKGYEMKKDELIQLWAANGFIPTKVNGEEILNCLVWRSFFQLVDTNSFYANDPYEYKMHDLMHDMALHVMGDASIVIESTGKVTIPNEVFHLSSSCPEFVFSPDDLRNLASLRSILFFGKRNESPLSQIVNHMYLRVLYLCNLRLETLPESIGKLKHLRYLNLSDSRIRVLPESIIHLQNLQMLILSQCHLLVELPKGLRHMVNLQCLDISDCFKLRRLPAGIKELTRLLILPMFPIDKEGGAKIGELGDLDLLEGGLQIAGLENVEGFSEAESANIKCKTNLSVLKLSWTEKESLRGGYKCDAKEVLEGLEPNPSLKVLEISWCMGTIISPSWMVNLENLMKISFSDCNCERLPPLGRLPNLRVIVLDGLDGLMGFHEDDTNMSGDNPNIFPSLQTLHIVSCRRLVSLPSNLPKLRVLQLVYCDDLVSIPDEILKDLNKLEMHKCGYLYRRYNKRGEDWPKVSHIPNINFW